MARGPAVHLLRIYSSKKLFSTRFIHSIPSKCKLEPSPVFEFANPPRFQRTRLPKTVNYSLLGFCPNHFSTLVKNESPSSQSLAKNGSSSSQSTAILESASTETISNDFESGGNITKFHDLGHTGGLIQDPVLIYKELRDAEKCENQTRADWDVMQEIFNGFSKSAWASNQSLAVYEKAGKKRKEATLRVRNRVIHKSSEPSVTTSLVCGCKTQ